jgi:Na+/H+ antiporter NhaD/arsenite permease-like protein
MEWIVLAVFVLGYVAIAFEHPLRIDKAASALLTGTLTWAIFVLGLSEFAPHLQADFADFMLHFTGDAAQAQSTFLEHRLLHHVQEIASILFFLMGAMTIVELVDAHEGFAVITNRIRTLNKVKLMWIVAVLTFFLSAVLDNLTTAIVMVSLLRKLIDDRETRWIYGGMVIIAANAGGAWSPIGDVTTTMLWIGGQITTGATISHLFLPSFLALLAPLVFLTFKLKGEVSRPTVSTEKGHEPTTAAERNLIFALGIGGLLFVPVFKTVTHLPPFMGMMLSLGVIWVVTEWMHRNKKHEEKSALSVLTILRKIDTASVLFFLGILLAVAALQEVGLLLNAAEWLQTSLKDIYLINLTIGFLSAVVDNVPLVAASMGMYEVVAEGGALSAWDAAFVKDGPFWQFLAFCAGTGGSMLIIGSAAGVAVMGLEKIDFMWYVRRVSGLAVLSYLVGALSFWLMFG